MAILEVNNSGNKQTKNNNITTYNYVTCTSANLMAHQWKYFLLDNNFEGSMTEWLGVLGTSPVLTTAQGFSR